MIAAEIVPGVLYLVRCRYRGRRIAEVFMAKSGDEAKEKLINQLENTCVN